MKLIDQERRVKGQVVRHRNIPLQQSDHLSRYLGEQRRRRHILISNAMYVSSSYRPFRIQQSIPFMYDAALRINKYDGRFHNAMVICNGKSGRFQVEHGKILHITPPGFPPATDKSTRLSQVSPAGTA